MPVFTIQTAIRVARGVRMFLNVEAGISRDVQSEPVSEPPAPEAGGANPEVRPENLVWIFGAGRTGSSWLMRMMGSLKQCSHWNEPRLGELFGSFYNNSRKDQLSTPSYVLGEPYRDSWLRSIRGFVLDIARARYPGLTPQHYLVIKEPGSTADANVGASLLSEALPESRVVLLIRDPRDVVASTLDAAKRGNWIHEQLVDDSEYEAVFADADRQPDAFVKWVADLLTKNIMGAKRAYEAHRGPKVLIRYEELLADTLGTMRRIFDTLGLPADEEQLARRVEKHSWEKIPESKKGEGKFFRKAAPGSWREDLTPEQIEMVERITAPILEEFYSDREASKRQPW